MSIYNTITFVPSGSNGWGDSFTNLVTSVDYLYAPYQGSFLYANGGDWIQPFNDQIFVNDLIYQNGNGDAQQLYPFDAIEGRVILKFPRLEQNPQLADSSLSYHPYTQEQVNNQRVAEYSALPSVHLQMTIQPVQFGDSSIDVTENVSYIENGSAISSPIYVEMIGTSNAVENISTRASDYVETQTLNSNYLASDIHQYKWEKIILNGENISANGNVTYPATPSMENWPLGTRDIFFNNPFEDPNEYEGEVQYLDEMVQLIPPVLSDSTLNSTIFVGYRLVESMRHMPPLKGSQWVSGIQPGQDINKGSSLNQNAFFLNADVDGNLFSLQGPNNSNPYNQPFYLNGAISIDNIKRLLRPSQITYSNDEVQNIPQDYPIRLVIAGVKQSVIPTDGVEFYKNPSSATVWRPEFISSAWTDFGVFEVVSYDEKTDILYLDAVKTFQKNGEGSDGSVWVFDSTINSLSGQWQVKLDPPIPRPDLGSTSGFNSVCDFQVMVNNTIPDNIRTQHFRASYMGYSYVKTLRYATGGPGIGTPNTLNWNSTILNGFDDTGLFYDSGYMPWAGDNNIYKSDRGEFFGDYNGPFIADLAAFDQCLPTEVNVLHNPQKFGLKYNLKEQQFELQIPHIPPCIIKGIYKVF